MIFNVQRFSLHDGPGIRTTVFFKGCPLRCPWCHNPESLESRPEVAVQLDRCLECGACVEVCPRPVGPLPAGGALGEDGCEACRRCIEACPSGAREVVGRRWTVDEVVAEVLRDRLFFDQDGGGVTFSGGEPLAQPDFLCACLERCRDEGIHTVLDTSGVAPREDSLRAAELSDLVLYDLKTADPLAHERLVGVPLSGVLDNLRALDALGARIWLRVPLVPGMNDDPRAFEAIARLVSPLRSVEKICLLPYHRIGTGKLARIGRRNGFDATSPSETKLDELAGLLRAGCRRVEIGG
jgi:pyruvate formate lyase activating enzyme